ncbi:MAG: trypsin-like peptidase domain-containing protein [Betaproteobacteria bacterium]|nr:trypsin-like peptidase domain-containing protein [Betaproteobacteria bacterium]
MHNRYCISLLALTAAALAVASAARADTSEEIFRNALKYTVQIKTTVPVPFDGDRKGSGFGAGFLVDAARGWVMTNAHVVSRSPSRVELAFHGQDFSEAVKIYVDPYLDLALIRVNERVDTRGVDPPQLDCGGLPLVGHPVGAFGHPWRLQFTGTRGIISGVTAKYRTELLQTDAPINAGNSGGPLISLGSGRIVGINTASIRGAQNTNFAVAMKYACRILQLLRDGRDPSPPDLGLVYFQDVDSRKVLKVARSYAASGALQLQPGDVIKEVVGIADRIENETQLLHALRGRFDTSGIKVLRNSQELVINASKPPMPRVLAQRGVYASGVLFGPVTFRDADEIRVRGFMVHHVEPGSIGESQEVGKSDLLEAIDGEKVEDFDQLFKRLSDAQSKGGGVQFTFKRVSSNDTMFSYTQRSLTIRDLRIIGPQKGAE